MSQYEDKFGNPIDPADLDDYEPDDGEDDAEDALDEFGFDEDDLHDVPDAPLDGQAAPAPSRSQAADPVDAVVQGAVEPAPMEKAEPAGLSKRGMLTLVGGGLALLALVGGGLAVGMGQIGNQNTAQDVRASGQSAVAGVKEKKDKVVAKAAVIDTCRVGMMDGGRSLSDALTSGSKPPPVRLVVDATAPLPGAFVQARVNADGVSGVPSLLQLTPTSWGVYTTRPLTRAEKKADDVADRPFWWKADAMLDPVGDTAAITGDSVWSGGDIAAAGACEAGKPGIYAATGNVPADAAGLVAGVASVDAIVGVAGEPTRAIAIMGDSIALVTLAEVPAEDEGNEGEAGTSESSE